MEQEIEQIRDLCLINSKIDWDDPEQNPAEEFKEIFKLLTKVLVQNEIFKKEQNELSSS